jgi:carboxyl-terminal processing protease
MPRGNLFALILTGAVTFFGWQASQGAKPRDEMMELYGVFVDAVEQVEANYVRPVSRRELLESALQGMLQNLDPHSQFISQTEWKSFKRKIEGRFGGIGITVAKDENSDRLKVIAPMVGTPAYKAGVRAGDLIIEIDGQSAEGISPDKAVEVLTGRPGSPVKLGVLHEGEDKIETISINRAIIDVPSVLGDTRKANGQWDFMLDKSKKIGYLRVAGFMAKTAEEVKEALTELKAEDMKGLILDLRDDPGGLLSAAVSVSDLFIDKGMIVSTRGRNTQTQKHEAQAENDFTGFPMVVLVNQGSASASEIVAACLQDHERAVVVGQRSFGKGSVQNIIDLDDGNSVLKLTVAAYYRPSGKNIHRFKGAKEKDEWGVSPNPGLEVKLKRHQYDAWADWRMRRDIALNLKNERAKPEPGGEADKAKDGAAKKEGEAKPEAVKGQKSEVESHDPQLAKALEVIKAKLAGAQGGN